MIGRPRETQGGCVWTRAVGEAELKCVVYRWLFTSSNPQALMLPEEIETCLLALVPPWVCFRARWTNEAVLGETELPPMRVKILGDAHVPSRFPESLLLMIPLTRFYYWDVLLFIHHWLLGDAGWQGA